METVLTIFEEIQNSKRAFKSNLKKIENVLQSDESEKIEEFLLHGVLDQALLHPKQSSSLQRVIDFFSLILSCTREDFQIDMVIHLNNRSRSTNKSVRQRVCLLLGEYLNFMSEENKELSNDILESISNILLARLSDKVATVRLAAVHGLQYLQDPDDSNDEITKQLAFFMKIDSSSNIRCAIARVLSLTEITKPAFIQRLSDTNKDVRLTILSRFVQETDIRQFPKSTRILIIQLGLNDREINVRKSTATLLFQWLQLLQNDLIKFFTYFGPVENETVVYQIASTIAEKIYNETSLESSDALQTIVPSWAEEVNTTTRTINANNIQLSDLLWVFVRCQYISTFQSKFQLQSFCEDYLPPLPLYLSIVSIYAAVYQQKISSLPDDECESSFSEELIKYQFSLRSYIQILPYILLGADKVGCDQIFRLIHQLLSDETFTFLVDSLIPICYQLSLQSSLASATFSFQSFQDMFYKITQELCTICGVSSLPSSPLNPRQIRAHLHLLTIIQNILQSCCSYSFSFTSDLLSIFLATCLHGLQQSKPIIRSYAVTCLGLLCMLPPSTATGITVIYQQYLPMIKHVAINGFEDSQVQQQGLRVLLDCCLLPHTTKYFFSSSEYPSHKQEIENFFHKIIVKQEDDRQQLFSQSIALEGVMKLIFSGFSQDATIISKLLQLFFIPSQSVVPASAETASARNKKKDSKKTACSEMMQFTVLEDLFALENEEEHIQQLLTVFFHSFLLRTSTSTNSCDDSANCFEAVRQSIPLFIADVTTAIRDEKIPPTALLKAVQNLFGICSSAITSTTTSSASARKQEWFKQLQKALGLLQETAFACISCEVLKLNRSDAKIDKLIEKEYIKLLTSVTVFDFDLWLPFTQVEVIGVVLKTIESIIEKDKVIGKTFLNLNKTISSFANTNSASSMENSRARPRFIDLAPGLSDIVRMSSDHLADTSTILGKSCLDKTSSGFNYLSDIEEGDDDDDDEDMYWPKQ